MLKILFLKRYESADITIFLGIEIFKLGIGLGIAGGKYESILNIGIVTYYDIE
jgi:hypothetical protein